MFTLLMAFAVVIVTWAGNIALAYVEFRWHTSRLAYSLRTALSPLEFLLRRSQ